MHYEFRSAERDVSIRLVCVECGKRAQGNVECAEGELCDSCGAEEFPHECEENCQINGCTNR